MWLLVAWLLDLAQFSIARANYSSKYNGFGVLRAVRERKALAPMAYRVLVPLLVGWIEDDTRRLWAYEGVKLALMGAGLAVYAGQFGTVAGLVAAVLWVATFRFDYWDVYVEFLAFALVLAGGLPWALLGAFLGALSKETTGTMPVLYLSLTGDALGACWVALVSWGTLLVVRARVGYRPMYCKRLMLRQNWEDLLALREGWFLSPALVSVVWTVGALWAAWAGGVGAPWMVPVLLVAGWTMGRIVEPRVFLSTSIWIAGALSRGIAWR